MASINFTNIPEELRSIPAWIVWKLEDIGAKKPTKVPYNPNGYKADTTDWRTWVSFEEAFNAYQLGNYSGIGFVFSEHDPFTFIDLDDCSTLNDGSPNPNFQKDQERQLKIAAEFDSYSETSPSGKGLHIIVKGKVAAGRRRSFIEVYSTQRYATFTGNVFNNKPVRDYQDKLSQLWEEMGKGGIANYIYAGDQVEKETDAEVIEKGLAAVNSDKFNKLLKGEWQDIYPSQSEADFAFIDMIAFYTQNREQIKRIFLNSPLGQRDKAKRLDYLNWMINKSFDRMLPPIDFDGFKNAIETKLAGSFNGRTAPFEGVYGGSNPSPATNGSVAQWLEPTAHNGFVAGSSPAASTNGYFGINHNAFALEFLAQPLEPPKDDLELPPGLMGDIARFIYQSAPRPVKEIAISAAIGLMAGICGRSYNISGTGLNQYLLLLAPTGTGKEAMAAGIDKLMNTIREQVPAAIEFIGPSEIASGQALVKHLNKHPCFVSILGEFGLRLQTMANANANGAEVSLRRIILDLYNKSGFTQTFRPSIYADKDKNITATRSPAFSILGESTPERFYGALSEEMISEGLLPRFMIIEYSGDRPPLNPAHIGVKMETGFVNQVVGLASMAHQISFSNKVVDVGYSHEATEILDAYDKTCDAKINNTSKEVLRQLWNRAHMKVLKLSALIAVGVNPSFPIIQPDHIMWAKNLIEADIQNISSKFEKGEIGLFANENQQLEEMLNQIKNYYRMPWEKIKSYTKHHGMYIDRVIPFEYLQRRLITQGLFRLDKIGATNAVNRTLKSLLDSDRLREVSKQEIIFKYGARQRCFILNDVRILD